ncbi:hypothetical protein ACFL20_08085 [Spirochaetota bacterium]
MKILSSIIIIFILFSASCKKKNRSEKEPNNSFNSSNILELDKKIQGYINSGNDKDFYIIEVISNKILDISLSGIKGVNHSFKIYSNNDTEVIKKWVDDNRKSSPERYVNFYAESGIYYIVVLHGEKDIRKANLETPYELLISSREFLSEEKEPNDNHRMATPIKANEEITGYFSPSYNRLNYKKPSFREEDWFEIDIILDSQKPALMDISLSAVAGINPTLSLYDSNLKLIIETDNTGANKEIKDIGISMQGKYYIMVASKSYSSNIEIPYTLNTKLKEYNTNYELEPNDNNINANGIINNEISGKINRVGDVDFFYYESFDNSSYKIELQSPVNLDLKLSIYDNAMKKIYDINNFKTGENEVLPNLIIKGKFYFAISSGASNVTDDKYLFYLRKITDIPNLESEPNNDKRMANRIGNNEIVGYISTKGDRDYFLLEYNKRSKHKIQVTGVKNGHIKVSLTDPLGYIIKSINLKGNIRSSFEEMIDGKGYIIVESLKDNYEYPYTINLRGIE